jgi:hypothetical protein
MAVKCLPKYLPPAPQPSTPTSRGLQPESRGLVDTCVEGCFSLIWLTQAENRELSRGCRHFFANCCKGIEKERQNRIEKRIGITMGLSIYTLYSRPGFELVTEGLRVGA